jgi:adenosine/AMP kinase
MSTPEASATVAVELERLRGTVATGFADVKGSLAVLMVRSERNEQDLVRLREDTGREITALKTEVEALKARRWPLGVLGAVTGVAGVATAVVSLFVH